MNFSVNELIEWKQDGSNKVVDRILWIDEGYVIAYTIDIFGAKAMPVARRIGELNEAINNGDAQKLNKDPWVRVINEDKMRLKDKKYREKGWNIISSIVYREPDIFVKALRGPMIRQVITDMQVTLVTVYKYLRRYWQRGKTPNALLPDFNNCGGKGKMKSAGIKKRGRHRIYNHKDDVGLDKNVDDETRVIFEKALKDYYRTPAKNSLKKVHELMIGECYKDVEPRLRPTQDQLLYYYRKTRDIKKDIRGREGPNVFELKHRPVLGSSTSEVIGPGSLYQIDATVGDVYVVSRFNRRWLIGRPVIYIVVDVFSRMVTGLYVGLEGPSWVGAMMALANAMGDKVSFCENYGIKIRPNDWPVHHAPRNIIGDRGEMIGHDAETMIEFLDIKVKNTPPFRADWKPIVERKFRTINEQVKPFVPGIVIPKRRGGRDYRLDAKLDIKEFTEILILQIIGYNNKHHVDGYELDPALIEDEVKPIPKDLWNWGILNRAGQLRVFDEDIVKLNLMPRAEARVTHRGITFKKIRYSCAAAIQEHWFTKAREATWVLDISYDPRNMGNIYIREANGRGFETCFVLEQHEKYSDRTLEEVEYLQHYERLQQKIDQEDELAGNLDINAEIEDIVQKASEKTEADQDPDESKRSILSGIKPQRKKDKEANQEDEAFRLGEDSQSKEPSVPETTTQDAENIAYNRRLRLLQKKSEEANDEK
ncbi:MAG TPA: transposase family protein [Syntrophomonadaceae bacterium]|nr:transposase family protein [Syntrophomonadaceae bacterium]